MKKYIILSLAILCGTIINAQVPQIERDALMALYNSTDGANWTDNTNWGSGNPVSTWYGISIENVGGTDHVTSIVLDNNNLGGSPTTDWANLIELKVLMLSENQLTGNLPIAISNCTKLVSLGLNYNNFEGNIPQEYSNLTLLHALWLTANNLVGDITNIYASMPNLGGLFLQNNNLSGSIDLRMNENLEYAILSDNNLSTIDARNGNNAAIGAIQALINPNLTCVFVDDKNNIPSGWDIGPNATYVETQAECDALGTEEYNATTFNIYPNPAKSFFAINSKTAIDKVAIYDIFGKLIKTFPAQNEYEISGLSKGLYLINIKSETGTSVERLIIE